MRLGTAISCSWSSIDNESGIDSYSYAIGTSPGSADVVAWTSVGQEKNILRSDLPLEIGRRYYVSAIAKNRASLVSQTGVSKPFTVLPGNISQTIGGAKKLQIGAWVSLPGKVVTAIFDDCIFIEEADRSSGIRCMNSPISLSVGDVVNVSGHLGLLNNEIILNIEQIERKGFSNPVEPVFMSGKYIKGPGLCIDGLLVRFNGKVVESGPGYIVISDGSEIPNLRGMKGVEVRLNGQGNISLGDMVIVRGVACKEQIGQSSELVIRSLGNPELVK